MKSFDDVIQLVAKLPGMEVATWYGTPGLKVGGKGFCRMWSEREYVRDDVHDTEVLVVVFDREEKSGLIDESNGVLFSTPHYQNHGGTLIRLADVSLVGLNAYIMRAYRHCAPAKLLLELASQQQKKPNLPSA